MSRDRVDRLYGVDAPVARRRAAFADGSVPIAVYGLGKMGLPLAAVYASVAGNVTGVDVDPAVVDAIEAGESHVEGEPGLDELVAEQVDRGRLRATTDGAAAATDAAVHVIIVPTLVDETNEPDLSTIEAVVDDIAVGLSPGDLVIAESTLPPGTCQELIRPHLEAKSGLERGAFGVAFCPERTSSGTALRDIRGKYPKVVGGVDEESALAASLVYDELSSNDVHVVSDATTAEAVKVFEGVYRDVNIALANELARIADELGVSVREAIETANELPMCQLHEPGPGVGGHCIPNYPHFLMAQTDDPMCLTRTARTINEGMPGFTVSKLVRELAAGGVDIEDATVLVCGFTYRPGVAETRSAPALEIVSRLRDLGATVYGVDPLVDPATYGAHPIGIDDVGDEALDAALLITPHEEFDQIDWNALEQLVVIDGRDALDLEDSHHRSYTLGGKKPERRGPLEDAIPPASTPARRPRSRPDGGDVTRE